MSKRAYKGYLIVEGFDGWFHVSKGGQHIYTAPSFAAACDAIDQLA